MLIHDDDIESRLNSISNFFSENISDQDLLIYYSFCLSDNIKKDYSLFDKSYEVKGDNNAGITILPSDKYSKITILLSNPIANSSIVLHELSHMYDMVQFSQKFCDNDLSKVKFHKHYQTFIFWTEFHAKQIDIPYFHILEKGFDAFKSTIKDFYFPAYTQKFISKIGYLEMSDIMWYLGEIVVCNLYDDKNDYQIPDEVKKIVPSIQALYNELLPCLDFESFANHLERLDSFFFG